MFIYTHTNPTKTGYLFPITTVLPVNNPTSFFPVTPRDPIRPLLFSKGSHLRSERSQALQPGHTWVCDFYVPYSRPPVVSPSPFVSSHHGPSVSVYRHDPKGMTLTSVYMGRRQITPDLVGLRNTGSDRCLSTEENWRKMVGLSRKKIHTVLHCFQSFGTTSDYHIASFTRKFLYREVKMISIGELPERISVSRVQRRGSKHGDRRVDTLL